MKTKLTPDEIKIIRDIHDQYEAEFTALIEANKRIVINNTFTIPGTKYTYHLKGSSYTYKRLMLYNKYEKLFPILREKKQRNQFLY